MPEVRVEESLRFMVDSLKAVGAPESEARSHAELLLHADLTGHFSHGMNRLAFYIADVQSGVTDVHAKPIILKESAGTAWVDGGNALGATVGDFCMDIAIRKAKAAGVGVVSAKRCNHFGMAGYWARKAEQQGLIGLAFTNSSPTMVPTRAKESALGTNPIALFAPAANGDSLGVDMATTAVALGKIEIQIHKEEPIPKGWAYGPDGQPTTDAHVAFDTCRMLPLGGFEETSGYKGMALSSAFEVLCGGLSGSKLSHQIRSWSKEQKSAQDYPDLGQCFMAIDPGCFAPGFGDRVGGLLRHLRNMEPADPSLPVLAPGDKERTSMEQTKKKGTISYAPNMIAEYEDLAKRLGVRPVEVVS